MGYKLVDAALAFTTTYNDRARSEGSAELDPLAILLLVVMAQRTADDAPEPVYFASRASTCAYLGLRDTEAGRKTVQRALGRLERASAVARPEKYQRGSTPRYRLIYQGGREASTFHPQVWTPDDPPTEPKVDARRPDRWTPDDRSVDTRRPLEEEKKKEEEGDARASGFELTPPPTPIHSDIPTGASPYCVLHQPNGTTQPCTACGRARKAFTTAERERDTRRRKTKSPQLRTVAGREICADGGHHRLPDGSCLHCAIHPSDLALAAGVTA